MKRVDTYVLERAGESCSVWLHAQSSRLTASTSGLSLNQMANAKKPKRKAMMVGVGLDSDGHKRITKGDNFTLVGGTKDTHEEMTEKAIKINEKLKARGKRLETVSRDEFTDIAHEVGLKSLPPHPDAN